MVTVQNSAPTEIVAGFTTTLATAHAEGLNAYLDYGNSNLAALDVGTAGADNSSAHGTAFIVGIRMTPPLTLSAHPLRAQGIMLSRAAPPCLPRRYQRMRVPAPTADE